MIPSPMLRLPEMLAIPELPSYPQQGASSPATARFARFAIFAIAHLSGRARPGLMARRS